MVVFYVSGHGFGHATRDLEIIHAIGRRQPRARVVVRTSAPRRIFDAGGAGGIVRQEADVDTGVAQIDSLRLDEDDTARRAAIFYADFSDRVDTEAALLRSLGATVVVGDIPPLAHAAAAQAGVPSVAIGNFTWDWIYDAYPSFARLAPGVTDLIREAYSRATLALRLPLHGGFDAMPGVVRDVPLVARHAARSREETRRVLGLDRDAIVALASFGAYGLGLPYTTIGRSRRFSLLVTDRDEPVRSGMPSVESPTVHRADLTALAGRGFHYPDLVAAVDLVVSKPGYGIVSECIANGTALLYTSRGRFREQDVFIEEMPNVLRCRFISQEDLSAGCWEDAVDALLRQPPPRERPATNGADVAAQAILEISEFRVQT